MPEMFHMHCSDRASPVALTEEAKGHGARARRYPHRPGDHLREARRSSPSLREASQNERAGRERAKRLNAHLGRTGAAVPSHHGALESKRLIPFAFDIESLQQTKTPP